MSSSVQIAPSSALASARRASAPAAVTPIAPARKKKETLPALTGLRCFAALNIVFFHFSNPKWFGPFAPIVDNGYTSVSFFLLMSGYILAYNYADRAAEGELSTRKFWIARFSRLYPVYAFALLLSLGMLVQEWSARPHGQFFAGIVLTPLLLQAWHPMLATFWNTPAWTMCTEAFFYLIFPLVILWKRPKRIAPLLGVMAGLWVLGMVLPSLYMWLHPDGDLHPGRYTDGFWIRALKFSPPPHVPSFLFGIALADLDAMIARTSWKRVLLGLLGISGLYAILYFGDHMPYVLMHDGLLMPLFALSILGLAGNNFIARILSFSLFTWIGRASYCIYILHFNLWNLIHDSHILDKLHLVRFDPWLSYFLLVSGAILVMLTIERPAQKWIRSLAAAKA